MKKLNLAIIGQGRSGKDIHGIFYRSEDNVYFNAKYVVDSDLHRRELAKELYPGCSTFENYEELLSLTDIDLVVNASFSHQHYSITKTLLENGFNVLVEKPLARNRYECEDLIKTAKEHNAYLIPFQQSFFAPYYLKAQEIVKSGVLGKIMQIDITYNNFARRWDWQTLQKKLGGGIYNTGPHPIGLALGFLDFDKDVSVKYSKLDKALTSGDSDDYAKILLVAPKKPLIDIEVCSNDANPAWNLKILGSRGTLYSNLKEYKLTYIVDGENPEKPVQEEFLQDENGNPIYCRENLIKHFEEGEFDPQAVFTGATERVYREIYQLILKNIPVTITAENAMQVVEIIDRVHAENPLPLIY